MMDGWMGHGAVSGQWSVRKACPINAIAVNHSVRIAKTNDSADRAELYSTKTIPFLNIRYCTFYSEFS